MRQKVQSGTIGEIVHLNSHFGYDLGGPFGAPVLADPNHWVRGLPAQVIYNVADYIFNKICEFLPGQNPAVEPLIWPGEDVSSQDDIASEMRVLIRDGPVTATATFSARIRPVLHRFEVFGTKGSLALDFNSGILNTDEASRHRGVLVALLSGYGKAWRMFKYANGNTIRLTRGHFGYFSGLQFLIRSFYRSILQDGPVPIPYDLILKVSRLTERVLIALKGRRMHREVDCLVTSTSGFLGRAVTAALLKKGTSIRCLVRESSDPLAFPAWTDLPGQSTSSIPQ